ncbi:MAG: signal peptidase II [Streptosporangiales bacterium]|nr:signal peptidase II [Streptosporangiales bacterium]MBO0892021.1 signal peptidase II [Acidothermales bacterium]
MDKAVAEQGGEAVSTQPRAPRRALLLVVVALLALAADATTKAVVVARIEGREPVRLLDGLLSLDVIRNSGAAFGIATGLTIVLTLIALGVVVAIARTARKLRSRGWAVALGLILGGALGNLSDRLFRAPGLLVGHVVDWIELPHWPIFNVADSCIVCGGVLAVLLAVRGVGVDGTRTSGRNEAEPETGDDDRG